MNRKGRAAAAALLGAAALEAFAGTPAADEGLNYQTSCSAVASNMIEGYVSNGSQDLYQVHGSVRFTFVQANSMSRRDIQIQADSEIPAGETARVASAQLTFGLRPNEACFFDVKETIRKQ